MYTPPAFRQNDRKTLFQHIHNARLTTLISQGNDGLIASHLPLLLAENEGEFGTLYGHLARANPHCSALTGPQETLAIFPGPDAYITPSWYPAKKEHGKVVPTWNYTAVHAYGQAQLIEDPQRLRALLGHLTDRHEQQREYPWSIEDAPDDFIEGILKAIVGFALPIRTLEGKWKLGQNRSQADFWSVRSGLTESLDPVDHALAEQMAASSAKS